MTAPSGWINDPLGVTWHRTADGGRYELFVQFNPDAPEWVPACRWGQLTAPDLVRWSWVGTALAPGHGEDGCWSGSVVVPDDGEPVMVYTSVVAGGLDVGRIALARGDRRWRTWTSDPAGPVLPGPPPGLAMTSFRDPFVWRADGGWRMVVGGGLADGRPVAVQYTSADLRDWRYDGVVADRPAGAHEPLGTGSVWECVQLFPLEGSWVLLVSVWEHGSPQRVAYAVGEHDGRRFTARAWRRFTATEAVYATTCFLDATGRRCAMSWIREPGAPGSAWAGALTLPVVLSLRGDRLALLPHPDVATLRTGRLAEAAVGAGESIALGPLPAALDLALRTDGADGTGTAALTDDDGVLLTLAAGPDGAVVSRPGRDDARLDALPGRAPGGVRLLLDAGIAEVFAAGDCGVFRVRPTGGPVRLRVSVPAGGGSVAVTVDGMPAAGN